MKVIKRIFISYFIPLCFVFIFWEILGKKYFNFRLLLSSPRLIMTYVLDNFVDLINASAVTLFESLSGFSVALIISFSTILFCIYFPKFLNWILPIFITSQVIPLITLAPMFILLFGVGTKSKVMMSALICYFPIFINFANGIASIAPNHRNLMFLYKASTIQKIKKMYIPLSLPSIFTGLKIASALSIIGAIVAEFNGARIGLGKNLFIAAKRLEPELMMASLFFSAILGFLLYGTIVLVERRFGNWYLNKSREEEF